jgi:hypothetical protein
MTPESPKCTNAANERLKCPNKGIIASFSDFKHQEKRNEHNSDRSLPICPLNSHALSTITNFESVDQQLHEWSQAFWIEQDTADPFHDDWGSRKE